MRWAYLNGCRVDPLVLVLVVDRHALGDRVPADQDRAPLAGELRVDHPPVVVAGR